MADPAKTLPSAITPLSSEEATFNLADEVNETGALVNWSEDTGSSTAMVKITERARQSLSTSPDQQKSFRTFEDLDDVLGEHFQSQESTALNQIKFITCNQYVNEPLVQRIEKFEALANTVSLKLERDLNANRELFKVFKRQKLLFFLQGLKALHKDIVQFRSATSYKNAVATTANQEPCVLPLSLNNNTVHFIYDFGTSLTLLKASAMPFSLLHMLEPANVEVRGVTNTQVPLLGKLTLPLKLNGKELPTTTYVALDKDLNFPTQGLLGRQSMLQNRIFLCGNNDKITFNNIETPLLPINKISRLPAQKASCAAQSVTECGLGHEDNGIEDSCLKTPNILAQHQILSTTCSEESYISLPDPCLEIPKYINLNEVREEQLKNSFYSSVILKLNNNKTFKPFYLNSDGVLLRDSKRNLPPRVCLPRSLYRKFMINVHCSSSGIHLSREEMLNLGQHLVYAPNISHIISSVISSCPICRPHTSSQSSSDRPARSEQNSRTVDLKKFKVGRTVFLKKHSRSSRTKLARTKSEGPYVIKWIKNTRVGLLDKYGKIKYTRLSKLKPIPSLLRVKL